jgi:hypothetical protein
MVAGRTQAPDQVQPVKAGDHPVDDEEIEAIARSANEPFRTACRLRDQMALFAKTVRDVISILSIILNQQDLQAAARFLRSAGPRLYRRSSYKIPMYRKCNHNLPDIKPRKCVKISSKIC